MKRKPSGFVAICQCGVITGAMDAARTEAADKGRILGRWLSEGFTVEPRFQDTWCETVSPCGCAQEQP